MRTGNGIVGRAGGAMFAVLVIWSIIDGQPIGITLFLAIVAAVFFAAGGVARNVALRDRGSVCFHCDQPLPKNHDPECEECGDQGCID